jgi:hypothetical protein
MTDRVRAPRAPLPATPASTRRSPWPIAIVVGLTLVALANAAFIYLAVSHPDPVVPSYSAEPR